MDSMSQVPKEKFEEVEDFKAAGEISNLKGVTDEQKEYYALFSSKDEEWRAYMTKKLLVKVDFRLLPMLVVMYTLNFLDRSNLSQARVGTLEEDLGMKGTDFNLATSILFVGYLLMQLPSNLLLTRVRPSIYLGAATCIWGVVSCSQAAVKSFGGLVACRFMLGIVEAPFFPGAIMMMSSWYTRGELAYRIAWFYSGNAMANMFGGLIGAGVLGNLNGVHGIAGWRWLFIIEGAATIGMAMLSMVLLPNFPASSKWLSDEERAFAQWRLVMDAKEADDLGAVTLRQGLKFALKDYRVYIFLVFQHLSLLSQTFQYFFPSIVGTLGFGKIETLLLTAPVWFCTFIVSLFVTYSSGRTGDRSKHIVGLMLVSFVGNVLATATLNTGVRFFAMFLMPMGAVSAYQLILAWIASTFPRPMVKRSAVIAICNMFGNTASIYGSYMYPKSGSPRYLVGGSANAGICLAVVVMAIGIRFLLHRQNKKLEKAEQENIEESNDVDARARGFRYAL
ncbi:major facilitator superfamily domain-containing protein [Lipomyces tetrasporus]|uniref:Major facilitator superfamily domain-containing protein n=1 Tax=Lipomyces tetrasporus TaxID=54092 RepID=A0AAD7QZH9_9ASCO|nr:major facilitator superfamily domain-containing protein [Lipomyces tetrasporus]KAJ8104352.1 major facilitator superfamily domain-containing protein [Lipomyces tetrasporus]